MTKTKCKNCGHDHRTRANTNDRCLHLIKEPPSSCQCQKFEVDDSPRCEAWWGLCWRRSYMQCTNWWCRKFICKWHTHPDNQSYGRPREDGIIEYYCPLCYRTHMETMSFYREPY